ncbi:putative 3-demethylubiquinone-9 3-methyltransferase (glyoxalase superfamily) [Chryseobacterium sp. H1D6B]|uniref:VOC family protein n=1 Tax=Chryseobacterium sp. H1D6B TaxID=2940588 RepID=UPI0015CDB419|nr:VOC family protein [Chryseobacterium sp. H1D6B]MDH6254259.1 putative 3-demethylubiquinone-9 3-methyltransferase (glyoxalase superfamily) [Chryseobacterium sp. H1D6B]
MNNNIFPCLLYDGNAKESAGFYSKVFNAKVTLETDFVVDLDFFGQKLMLLNGPQVEKNASVSFLINCESEDEVQNYWEQMMEGGMALMPLDSYPWSTKYGWVKDKYSVNWQLYLGEKRGGQKIIPTLMFMHQNNGKAMEAIQFYTQTFPNSEIGNILRYKDGGEGHDTPEVPENIQHAHFIIDGYNLFCMDSSYDHQFDFNDGISMVVMTDDQKETDHLWNTLISDGGSESVCGWLKDKYGLSWQIAPKRLIQLINDPDKEKAGKVMQAMMKMKKIILKDIEEAYNS